MSDRAQTALRRGRRYAAIAFTLLAAAPLAARADQFVLTAGRWGKQQSDAVAAAGGTVAWSHAASGIAVVHSDDADFLTRAMASKAFQTASPDVVVQWQPPVHAQDVVNAADDTYAPLQWSLQAIHAPQAWAAGCTGRGVRVAVIDGGIYDAHPDLAGAIDGKCSTSFVAGQPFNSDVGTFWHGTHVAGIIAARDNSIGVVGIAPQATIVGVKALHDGDGSFGAIIGAILYAADPAAFGAADCAPADIINMSLGAVFPKDHEGPLVGAVAKAVNFAASKGVLVVSAAGNDALDLGHSGNVVDVPAESGSGVAVSATAPIDWAAGNQDFTRLASYSNYGDGVVFVGAPGGDAAYPGNELCTVATATGSITNPCWVFDMVLSTSRAGYSWAAGTSMASPTAAAVAALIKGRFPHISLGELKARLAQSADDAGKVGHDQVYGNGFVNAARACTQ